MRRRAACLALALLLLPGCVIFPYQLRQPPNDKATVMVMSNRLGGPIRRIARHAYIAVRGAGEENWTVWECCSPGSHATKDPFVPSFGDEVRMHGMIRGKRAERAIACLPGATERYGRPRYWPWPGPNSNTYVEAMLRECDIPADLPATSVGKDWRGWFGISWTSGGTGFQIETPLVGLKLGLTEGVEVHVLGLSLGVDLWPPALILPVGDGRLGFGDRR